LVCLHLLHFPYRSLAQYSRKAEQGVAALEKTGKDESIATHWRGWVSLSEAGRNERWLAYLRGDVEASGAFSTTDRLTVPDPTRWRTWDPDGFFAGVRLPDQA
jgi:hypothetical protein